ncbi:MAG TPA: hypothetical protein VF148_07710 [Acidimicrobiia bacterium]
MTWSELASDDPAIREFVADKWLDGRRGLRALPAGYDTTRRALHQLAFFAVAPARHAATGKLGLRYTRRGFGTPFFGSDHQIRVESGELVYQRGHDVDSIVPGDLGEACESWESPIAGPGSMTSTIRSPRPGGPPNWRSTPTRRVPSATGSDSPHSPWSGSDACRVQPT